MRDDELIVDSFAGGGGASLGITWALGRGPDVAINHDPEAIAMHTANHPRTRHYTEDIWKADPRRVVGGRPVGLLWSSPDCKHFSRAKGGKPVEKGIRSLAWVVIRWAAEARPRVIILENVREFADWGPLVPRWWCPCGWKGTEGQAALARARRRCPECHSAQLRVDYQVLVPDPGRKGLTFRRFVGRLRGLGYAVEWRNLNAADYGAPTHRRRLFLVARCDGRPIVWPEPTHGPPGQVGERALFGPARQPWRTAAECIDWSLPCPSIFDRKRPLAEKTLRRIAAGVRRYVLEAAQPFLVNLTHHGSDRVEPVTEPFRTITAANRGEKAVICPTLIQTGYGERAGQAPRALDLQAPLGTVVGNGTKHALVAAFLAKHFGGVVGHGPDRPLGTVTAKDHHSLVAANLLYLNAGPNPATNCEVPLRTVTSGGQHAALVYSFLMKYFGSGGQWQLPCGPLHTATSKARFGLVTVTIEGQTYALVDIGLRMLTPRELARAQGFPDDYALTGSKTSQVARVGNSVSPVMAQALVAANCTACPATTA